MRTIRQLIVLAFVLFFAVPLYAASVTITSITPGTGQIVVKGKYTVGGGETFKGIGCKTVNKTTLVPYPANSISYDAAKKTWTATIPCPAGTYNPTTPSILITDNSCPPEDVTTTGTADTNDQTVK